MPLKEDVTETQAGGVEQPKDAPTTPEVNIQTPPAQNDSVPPAAAPPVDSQQQSVKSNQESTGEIPLNTEELKTTNTSFAAEVFQYVESNPKINMGEITLEDFTSKYFNPDDVGSTAALWSTLDKKKASATYDLDLGGYHQFQSNAITVTPPKSAKLQQDFNDNKVVLSAEKEAEFQTYMETDPTVQDYKKQVLDSTGNEFDLDSSDTDYRKAWQSGDAPQVTNEKAVNGDSIVSWNTISKDGEKLKSQNHVDVQSAENDEEILANQMLPQFDEFDAENFFLEYSDKLKAIQASDIETQIPKHKLVSPNAPHIQEAIDAYNGEWEKSEKIKNEQMLLQTELGKSNPSAANRKGADVFWEKKYKDMGLSKTQIKELTDARKNAATNTAAKDVLKTAKVTRKKFEINPDGTTSQTSQDVNFVDITPREILFDIVDEEDLKKQVRDKGGDDRLTEALFSEMKETAWKQVRVEERAKGLEEVRNQYPRKDSEQHEKIYARKVASEVFEMLPEEDRELYEIEKKVAEFNDPSATPVLTNAIIAERFKLEERRRELTEQKRLYNPMTGQLVAQEDATKAQIEANDKVEADIEELKKLPLEEIEKQFTQRYLEFAAAKDRWETISAPLHAEATERMKAAQEKDAALMKVHPTSDNGTTGAYIVERTNEYDRARENFEEKSLELRAASGAYLLNKDATTIEKDFGYWSELFGRSAAASLLPEGVEKSLMAAGAIDMSDRQMLDYTQQAMGGGVFTDEQAEAFERNFGENVAEFGGGLVGIAIQLAVLNKATAAARIPQLINTLRTSEALGRFAKPMAFLLEGAVEEVKLQGLGFHSGEGYGFVAAGKVMPQMLLKGKIGAIMQPFFNAAVQGSVGGTVGLETATIMGTTVDALMENKDWQFRMEESGFGDLSEVGQRIATELMVNSVYGGMHIKKNAFVVDPQKLNTLATELIAKGHIQEAQSVIEKAQQIDGSQQALIEFNKTNDIAKISITKEGSKVEVESVPNEADVAEPAYSIDGESMSRDEFLNTINSSEFRRKVAEGADMSVQVDNDNNVTTKVSELYEAEKTEKKEGEAPAKPVERKKEEDDIKDGKIRFNVKSKAELPKEYQDLEPSTSGETTVDGKTTLNFTFDKIAETPIVEIPTGTTKRGDKVAVENKDGENNVWKVEAVAENGTVSVEDVLSKKKREFTQEEWAEVKGVETKVQETIDTEAKEEVETPKKKTADTRTDLEQAHVTKERLEEKATHPSGLNAKEKKALKKVDAFIKQEEAKAETTVKTPVVNEGDIVEVGKKNYKKVKSPVEEVGEYYQEVDADGKNVAESMPMKVEAIEAELAVVKLEELVEGLEKGTITKEEAKTETPVEAPKPEPITQEEAQKTVDDVKARLTERKRKGQMPINEFTKKSAAEKEIDTLDAEIDKLNSMGAVKRKLYEVTSELTVKGAIKGLEAERKEAAKTYQTEQAAKAKKSAAAAKKVKADEVSALEFELERAERALGESKGEVNLIKGDPVAGGAKDIYKTDLHFVQHLQNKTKKAEAHVAKQEKRLEDKKAEHKEFKVNDPKEIKLYEDFVADAKREVEKTKKEQETFLKKLATESKSGKIADNILGLKGIEAPKVEKKTETKPVEKKVETPKEDTKLSASLAEQKELEDTDFKTLKKEEPSRLGELTETRSIGVSNSVTGERAYTSVIVIGKDGKKRSIRREVPSSDGLDFGYGTSTNVNGHSSTIKTKEQFDKKVKSLAKNADHIYTSFTPTSQRFVKGKEVKKVETPVETPKAEVKSEVEFTESETKLENALDSRKSLAKGKETKTNDRNVERAIKESEDLQTTAEERVAIKKELGATTTRTTMAAIAKSAAKGGKTGKEIVESIRRAKKATATKIREEVEARDVELKEQAQIELESKKIADAEKAEKEAVNDAKRKKATKEATELIVASDSQAGVKIVGVESGKTERETISNRMKLEDVHAEARRVGKIIDATESVKELKDEVDTKKGEIEDIDGQVEDINTEVKSVKSETAEALKELKAQKEAVKKSKKSKAKKESAIDEIDAAMEDLKDESKAVLSDHRADLAQLKSEKTKLDKQLDKANKAHTAERSVVRKTIPTSRIEKVEAPKPKKAKKVVDPDAVDIKAKKLNKKIIEDAIKQADALAAQGKSTALIKINGEVIGASIVKMSPKVQEGLKKKMSAAVEKSKAFHEKIAQAKAKVDAKAQKVKDDLEAEKTIELEIATSKANQRAKMNAERAERVRKEAKIKPASEMTHQEKLDFLKKELPNSSFENMSKEEVDYFYEEEAYRVAVKAGMKAKKTKLGKESKVTDAEVKAKSKKEAKEEAVKLHGIGIDAVNAAWEVFRKSATFVSRNTLGKLGLVQKRYLEDKLVNHGEDWIAEKVQEGMNSSMKAVRNVSRYATAWANGLPRTNAELHKKLSLSGNIKDAQIKMQDLQTELYKIVNGDSKSVGRVHKVLDPALYEGGYAYVTEGKAGEKIWKGYADGVKNVHIVKNPTTKMYELYEMNSKTGERGKLLSEKPTLVEAQHEADVINPVKTIEYKDLNSVEKVLHDKLRELNDYTHDYNFSMGFITKKTYDSFIGADGKGTYIGRGYETFELPDHLTRDLDKEWVNLDDTVSNIKEEANQFLKVKGQKIGISKDMFKARKEIDDYKRIHKIDDAIFLTSKRMMQTEVNAAIREYSNAMAKNPKLVREEPLKGFSRLEGKAYGDLNGKYVANHIVEDFKGFFYANKMLDSAYSMMRIYDRLGARQFLKKFHTVYSPTVQLGNFMSNYVFGFASGVDPISMAFNKGKAAKEIKEQGKVWRLLTGKGILGSEILTEDLAPVTKLDQRRIAQMDAWKKEAKERAVFAELTGLKKIRDFALDQGVVARLGFSRAEFKKNWEAAKTKKEQSALLKDTFLQFGKDFDASLTKTYENSDNIQKVAAYMSLREAGFTEKEAVEKVYSGFQNYATVGKLWDMAAKTPVIGNPYVKFQADLQRIVKNAALKSPLSVAVYYMTVHAMTSMGSYFADEDEQHKEVRENRPYIPKMPMFDFLGGDAPLVFNSPIGEVNIARYVSPFYLYDLGDQQQPLELLSKYLPYQVRIAEDGDGNLLSNLLGGVTPVPSDVFLGVYASALIDNKDFRNKSISDPTSTQFHKSGATQLRKTLNSINYVLRSQLPLYSNGQDLYLSTTYGTDHYGRDKNPVQVMMSTFLKISDFTESDFNKAIEMDLRATDYKKTAIEFKMKGASKEYMDNMAEARKKLDDGDITEKNYKNIYEFETDEYNAKFAEQTDNLKEVQIEWEEKGEKYLRILSPSNKGVDKSIRNSQSTRTK